jgi:hypothetical protein
MRHHEQCQSLFSRKRTQERNNLGLNMNVESRRWLIANYQLRFSYKRHRNQGALTHSTR